MMKKKKADLGAAFDGDADRVAFVDEKGKRVRGDITTALIAKQLLKTNPGQKILYDLRSSWIVPEKIKEWGGEPIKTRVGHSFIKQTMRDEDAILGGELSFHFYFRDNFYVESSVLATYHLIRLMEAEEKPLSQLAKELEVYAYSGEINSQVKDVGKAMERVESHFAGKGKVSRLDGLTVEHNDWWFNVRPSNTEPVVRLVVEAKTKKLMEQKRDELLGMIRKSQ